MMVYTLRREQLLPQPIDRVFTFFADAANLEAITPLWLRFQILTPLPISTGPGTLIEYRLRWHEMPIHWVTRIDRWEPPTCFSDVQLRGPYRLWERCTHLSRATLAHGCVIWSVMRTRLACLVDWRIA
jgi:ligand-binding SRPBCC domain-containing protein